MANLQYIGARYVPKFFTNPDDQSNDWKAGVLYEALMIVTYNNDSYTSKKVVPDDVGNPADNPEFWACTTKYTAALVALQNNVGDIQNLIGSEPLETEAQTLSGAINEVNGEIVYTKNFITPEKFGAKGDGVTDDSSAFIQCVNYVGEGGTIALLPNKKYLISANIPAVNIVGNNATIIAKASVINDNYALKIVPSASSDGQVVIRDLTIDCKGTTASDGMNGIYIDGLKNSQFININIINVGEYGIYLYSGFDITFRGILLAKPKHLLSLFGDGVYSRTSDLIFNDITVKGCFARGFYDRGYNIYNNIHIWIGTDLNIDRTASIGIEKTRGGIINNLYIDSLCTGVLVNQVSTLLLISNVHWLILEGQPECVFLKNDSGNHQRLNNVVIDNIYVQVDDNTTVNYSLFDDGSPTVTSVLPRNLPAAKTYGHVPYSVSEKVHLTRDIIRIVDDFIYFEIDIVADEAVSTSDEIITLTSYPIKSYKVANALANGSVVMQTLNNNIYPAVAMAANDTLKIHCLVPIS